jgi:hypothetical protein
MVYDEMMATKRRSSIRQCTFTWQPSDGNAIDRDEMRYLGDTSARLVSSRLVSSWWELTGTANFDQVDLVSHHVNYRCWKVEGCDKEAHPCETSI